MGEWFETKKADLEYECPLCKAPLILKELRSIAANGISQSESEKQQTDSEKVQSESDKKSYNDSEKGDVIDGNALLS